MDHFCIAPIAGEEGVGVQKLASRIASVSKRTHLQYVSKTWLKLFRGGTKMECTISILGLH